MTRIEELQAKAEHFASRAASAKRRRERNTCLSLEQSYRSLAAEAELSDAREEAPGPFLPALAGGAA